MNVEEVAAWSAGFEELMARIAGRFSRVEPRRRARAFLLGLLSPVVGRNGWTLVEAAGDHTPDRMQRLLNEAAWDADAVRDDLRGFVVEHLGDSDGVLVIDKTGFVKKGNLCPPRHKLPYDEPAVMPRPAETPLGSAGVRCRARHNR